LAFFRVRRIGAKACCGVQALAAAHLLLDVSDRQPELRELLRRLDDARRVVERERIAARRR